GHAAALVTLTYDLQSLRPVMAVLVCTVIAALALFDNNDFITAGQHSITLVRQGGTHGNHHAACLLQPLRKLPDRING
ncbi:4Fe-4S ferredoxin-type domain-containing protein, partial [Dysosmobacter welbionis]